MFGLNKSIITKTQLLIKSTIFYTLRAFIRCLFKQLSGLWLSIVSHVNLEPPLNSKSMEL